MTLKEKRLALFEKFKDKPFICGNIPCYVRSANDIQLSYSRCPKCGCETMNVYVSSPAEYWQNLCGREGRVTICSYCGEYGEFKLMRMN